MKQIFEMKDKKLIETFLKSVEYGTLAICIDNRPYSVPLNFVNIDDVFYFHGAKRGKKIDILKQNMQASFSVVKSYSMIQSYFSSIEELACPATQFFKSVIADGTITFVDSREEKVMVMSALMQKLQPEDGYKPLSEGIYKKALDATMVYKLEAKELCAKFKFGQHLTQDRFDMILEHLEKRGNDVDAKTSVVMQELKDAV
jgi:nitroimidazol reductase NimA-like FMN-containing flavoprotein (pyridoxamine 5'-phosphate oxidase superfamily)